MGAKKLKRDRFLEKHPACCFCGGFTKAASIDHIPSRSCFIGRIHPEGFEFPACDHCNQTTSNDEQWVAWLSYVHGDHDNLLGKNFYEKMMKGVANNHSYLFSNTRPLTRGNAGGIIELPANQIELLDRIFSKWAKAFYYKETGKIAPKNSNIVTKFYSNLQKKDIPQIIFEGKRHDIKRNNTSLNDQMELYSLIETEKEIGFFGVSFRMSFFVVMFVDIHRSLEKSELIANAK